MSLFQFGFSLSREEPSPEDSVEVEILESHIPRQEDTNLGVVEHRETAAAVVNLSRPPRFRNQINILREKGENIFNTAARIA